MDVIVYNNFQGSVSVVSPAADVNAADLLDILPAGVTGYVVDSSKLPTAPQSLWTLDDQGVLGTGAAPPPPVPETITEHQFVKQLIIDGAITSDEGLQFLSVGTIPSTFADAIAQLPEAAQPMARVDFVGAKAFDRHNPLVIGLGALIGKSPTDLDGIWTAAAKLT